MSMLNAYCVDPVTIVKFEGADSWGEPYSGSSGSWIDVKGYVEWKTKLVRDHKGEERVSSVMIYLPLSVERPDKLGRKLSHDDRIQIGGESFDRAIIDIRRPKDFSHPHLEIYLA